MKTTFQKPAHGLTVRKPFRAPKIHLVLFAALMAAIPARAQENDKFKILAGAQVSAAIPQNKFEPEKRYRKTGITNGRGFGMLVEFIWRNKFAVRPQFEYMSWEKYEFKRKHHDVFDPPFDYISGSIKAEQNMVILDFISYNNIKYLPYFFGGIGLGEKNESPEILIDESVGGEPLVASLHCGAGYKLTTNFSLEIKYAFNGYGYFQGSVICRF